MPPLQDAEINIASNPEPHNLIREREENYGYIEDTGGDMPPPLQANNTSANRDNGSERLPPLGEAQIGGPVLAYESYSPRKFGTMNQVEQRLAQYSFDHNLSNSQYARSILLRGPHNYIYHCVPALAAYSADFPEQRLLACVKSGTSTFSCPRCYTPTNRFNEILQSDEVTIRGNFDMEGLYNNATSSLMTLAATRKFCKEKSIFPIKHAFWSVRHFDIYAAIVADDLHQLGGLYKYLLQCIEKIIRATGNGKLVSDRAAAMPPFTGLRQFKAGFLPSSLKNTTYGELRAHMKIVMSCIHDQIPLQASLCLRHFIDFYMLATAKEHSYKSLEQMKESLQLYNKYSPIFEKYSPVSKVIVRREQMYDEYPQPLVPPRDLVADSYQLQKPQEYELKYPRYNGALVSFQDFIHSNGELVSSIYDLVRTFTVKKTICLSPCFSSEFLFVNFGGFDHFT
ncbi:hypothetical protein BJV82DRAFT_674941 [Fennellomyces sp. T-0311]|nr:hypothetical protein BJV82DRAFT_674941 [Fennellomyces sp. T-0311]